MSTKVNYFLFVTSYVFLSVLQWQKRYFVLHTNKKLHYYKNDKEKRPVKDPINLALCKTVESHLANQKFKNVFSVVTDQRTYFLVADTQFEMENWVEKICNVCGFTRTDNSNNPGKIHACKWRLYMYYCTCSSCMRCG